MTFVVLLWSLLSAVFLPSADGGGIAGGIDSLAISIPARLPSMPPAGERLSKGKFLVATERITDPRFRETVILLISSDKNGAMGLIINRPTGLKFSSLFPDIKELQKLPDTAFIGGPVGMEQLFLLVRSAVPPEESLHVFRDIYVSTSMSLFKRVAPEGSKAVVKFRLYAGYAGWGAGQIERELSKGDWHILQADPETVFSRDPGKVWQDLIRRSSAIWVKRESPEAALLTVNVR